jgi:CRP/FNR family transcriptional regulator, cyclic AMP receptor protein
MRFYSYNIIKKCGAIHTLQKVTRILMVDVQTYTLGQIADLLSSDTAFAGMPRAQAMRIVELMAMREFSKGQVLMRQGQENIGYLMLVVSGQATVSSQLVNSIDTMVHRRAVPGHLMGEVGFIDGEPHSATSIADTDMHVAVLPREQLSVMLDSQPKAAAQLMAGLLKILAQRVRHANMTMQTLGIVHAGLQKEIAVLRKAANG